jgi:hypothetical protein
MYLRLNMSPSRVLASLTSITLLILAIIFRNDLSHWLNPLPAPGPGLVGVETAQGTVKHGTVVTNNPASGRPHTSVTYELGKKHGWSYVYYPDGKSVLLAMPYVHGKRHGTSVKYFRDGKVHTETPYVDDKIHGIRRYYFSNGKPMSEISYAQGYAGTGLREYTLEGNLKTSYPELRWKRKGNRIYPELVGYCTDISYYLGALFDGRHFNPSEDAVGLPKDEYGTAFIDLDTYTPSYLSVQDLICTCSTRQGNPYVTTARIKP